MGGAIDLLTKVLVTGAAGFIGYHLSRKLLNEGFHVVGLDNLNAYYDVQLKRDRLDQLLQYKGTFEFHRIDLAEIDPLRALFETTKPDIVVNLAAQAGVRYSLENPHAYLESNLKGFVNILELCRQFSVKHLVYASSSSVYGANTKMPFSVHQSVDHPLSLYAATKKSNELMAHSYSHLYGLPTTGLRFFTVYGPWGRPDMALFIFTKSILEGRPIKLFNHGDMKRDFTYIDDITDALVRVIGNVPRGNPNWSGENPDPATSLAPYRVYNIGNNRPITLNRFVEVLEEAIGKVARKELLPMQPGDVPATYADVDSLVQDVNFKPSTPIEIGIRNFVDWYRDYYGV